MFHEKELDSMSKGTAFPNLSHKLISANCSLQGAASPDSAGNNPTLQNGRSSLARGEGDGGYGEREVTSTEKKTRALTEKSGGENQRRGRVCCVCGPVPATD